MKPSERIYAIHREAPISAGDAIIKYLDEQWEQKHAEGEGKPTPPNEWLMNNIKTIEAALGFNNCVTINEILAEIKRLKGVEERYKKVIPTIRNVIEQYK